MTLFICSTPPKNGRVLLTRDKKTHHIAHAIARVLAAGLPMADSLIILNHWR